jgi:tetratricopeptide (TPR) repeat protein
VWLDTTAEVGPYQYLVAPLRDKHALAIWKEKPAALSSTPADLPYQTMQKFDMDAQLDDSGTLEGRVEFSARGDNEFLMRSGFRAVALPQWRELGQRISFSLGFGGEVSEVTASSPEKTDEPFHFAYKYTRKEYGDWANRRTVTPSPLINLLAPGDEELLPLGPSWLGELLDVQCHSRMQLPSGYRPELPPGAHLKWNFAEYDSTYEFKDGALISDRHLKTLLHEVPASQREDYKQFMKTMLDDYGYFISLSSRADTARAANNDNLNISLPKDLADLPISLSPEAMRLEGEAHDAMANHDGQGAVSSLYRAVAADPKFTRAWVILGALLLIQKQIDAGIDAYHKAMAADPTRAEIPKALGGSLMWSSHYQQAVPVWQEYLKAHPDDINVSTSLGFCLFQLKRYSEAADAYAAALKIDGTRAVLIERLGTSYLLAGARDKAEAAFAKLAGVSQDGSAFNDAAYEMANADLNLPQAREYAKKAVRAIEEQSQKITLPDLKEADLRQIQNLSAYWDTLGWINERMSDLDSAELYLRAAWKLTQDPVVATHLCQVYEKVHKIEAAVPMCHMALERAPMPERQAVAQYKAEIDAEQERLDRRASATKLKNTGGSSDVLTRERTFKLERFLPGTESAEFFLLLASDGKSKTFKVEDVKFVSGSAKMKLEGKQLKSIDFNFPSPSDFPTRFVRRGILGCYQYTGCSFVLFEPASVRSVE